jgi:signal transduction histidine kinase
MLGNLIDNACKWARARVSISARADGDRILLTIDDDGPGLPADRRTAVFDRGTRLDESVPGSGLGLAIVRDIAELYHGAIALDDSPLGGLRAVLTLPAAVG